MRRRLILIVATWAAVVGLVVGSAPAQTPTPPGGGFVLIGVVMLEDERGLAWIQEPSFTDNKVVTVRLGDSVGPYRVTKILTHQVELTGAGGTIFIPLAGLPGAVGVASSSGSVQPSTGEKPPQPALKTPPNVFIPLGDPRGDFPASKYLVGAGAVFSEMASQPSQPQASQPQPASVQAVPALAAVQVPVSEQPNVFIPRGDPRRNFPTAKYLIGAR